jgi:hypothetical protein
MLVACTIAFNWTIFKKARRSCLPSLCHNTAVHLWNIIVCCIATATAAAAVEAVPQLMARHKSTLHCYPTTVLNQVISLLLNTYISLSSIAELLL